MQNYGMEATFLRFQIVDTMNQPLKKK